MKSQYEKLREMMKAENRRTVGGSHLRDEDFISLIEAGETAKNEISPKKNDDYSKSAQIAALRQHLVGCDLCVTQFRDFYAFFAPAESDQDIAAKADINAAWENFAPQISGRETKPRFWSRRFVVRSQPNFFAAFGWGLAAVLLMASIFAFYSLKQSESEKTQLAAQLEIQKQAFEDSLKSLAQTSENSNLAELEKSRLTTEKTELQKQIAALESEMERRQQTPLTMGDIKPPPIKRNLPQSSKTDNSLVAVNTPIYDVLPSDAVVRGEQSANKLLVPKSTKSLVLILNAAGRADYTAYRAELLSGSGKTIWRGGGLRKDDAGNFTVTLSKTLLTAGNYRLKLFGKTDGSFQTVAEYPINIADQ